MLGDNQSALIITNIDSKTGVVLQDRQTELFTINLDYFACQDGIGPVLDEWEVIPSEEDAISDRLIETVVDKILFSDDDPYSDES